MAFRTVGFTESMPKTGASEFILVFDRWDDWGKYRTQFFLWVFDHKGELRQLGEVKIGSVGLKPGSSVEPGVRAPEISPHFEALGKNYFSLGQSETYYESLNQLPQDLKNMALLGLRDMAFDLSILDSVLEEEVTKESLLRHIREENVRNRFHRLSIGDSTLTHFSFSYRLDQSDQSHPLKQLDFTVSPDSLPPTNIHVLIGRNGVGKTYAMQNIAKSLIQSSETSPSPSISALEAKGTGWSFSGLVLVSFSAFDDFEIPTSSGSSLSTSYVGLKQQDQRTKEPRTKSPFDLSTDFIKSFDLCRVGIRADRWAQAVSTLSSDPIFNEADVQSLLRESDEGWEPKARLLFKKLSSGHKLVLLTVTKLVELVAEKTLVIIDEPEGHLHPPLLSAFVRSLSDLLMRRNGVAIIATHSPVVLQEVPSSCVWMLRRIGLNSFAERPSSETFGENVGVLTREVFGLEMTTSGFHKMINDAVSNSNASYDQIVERFSGQLGAEGRAIARSLVNLRDSGTRQ